MKGRQYKNFDEFRRDFWKNVSSDPVLSKKFNIKDIKNMQQGLAPRTDPSQWNGQINQLKSYNLHHKIPINKGGGVYDIDNIVIVTPKFHKEILDPKFHRGK